jgi:transposase InsO family protein
MHTGVSMRARYVIPKMTAGSYTRFMKTVESTFKFESSDVAKYRLKVLTFFKSHGLAATEDAFSVGKSTLYEWKTRLIKGQGRLNALVPHSTRPHRTRHMEVDDDLLAFIRSLRECYGRVGKEKLKPLLDAYARSLGLTSYGKSKIGKIIKRNHYFFAGDQRQKQHATSKKRIKYAPRVTGPGYVELDSVTVYMANKRHYFINVIDVYTKVALAKRVPSLSSCNAKSLLEVFRQNNLVSVVQTDNGSEFMKDFDHYLSKEKIDHIFTYPHSPKINGVIERFNRTLQEEFVERCDSLWHDWAKADEKLTKYLNWYNEIRPHQSLKQISPMTFARSLKTIAA